MFEHALRIRLSEERSTKSAPSSVPSPDPLSLVAAEDSPAPQDADTSPSTQSTTTAPVTETKPESEQEASNLIGKINNLITSDLNNITMMTELAYVTIYAPLKVIISIWFLYSLLGWRLVLARIVAFVIADE